MITTRRETLENTEMRNEARSRLGLLERPAPSAYNEVENYEPETVETMSPEENKKRMSENFNILLNYEKYVEEAKRKEQLEATDAMPVIEEKETVMEEPVAAASASTISKEDITPTSTTMQFGTDDIGNLYSDMKKEDDTKFRLNNHGKIMVAVYSIVVAVIMALIIINTSVLASLRRTNAAKVEELATLNQSYERLSQELENISSDEYVIETATGEYNMVENN